MTDLFNLQTAEYAAVALLLTGLILQSIVIYIYQQHSQKLGKALENNTRGRQAERKLQAEKIRVLEQRVAILRQGAAEMADPEVGVEIISTDVQMLRCSATFDRSQPQYQSQSDELLSIMSRQEILKEAAKHITTTYYKESEDVITFEHSLLIIKKESHEDHQETI